MIALSQLKEPEEAVARRKQAPKGEEEASG
jgi:hypothetical protein